MSLIIRTSTMSVEEIEHDIVEYIEMFYNIDGNLLRDLPVFLTITKSNEINL